MNAQLCIKEPLVPSLVSIHILHPQVWLQGYAGCSLSLAGEITLKSFLHLGIDPQAFFCKTEICCVLRMVGGGPLGARKTNSKPHMLQRQGIAFT